MTQRAKALMLGHETARKKMPAVADDDKWKPAGFRRRAEKLATTLSSLDGRHHDEVMVYSTSTFALARSCLARLERNCSYFLFCSSVVRSAFTSSRGRFRPGV